MAAFDLHQFWSPIGCFSLLGTKNCILFIPKGVMFCHPLHSSQELECKGVIKCLNNLDLVSHPDCILSKKKKLFMKFRSL